MLVSIAGQTALGIIVTSVVCIAMVLVGANLTVQNRKLCRQKIECLAQVNP